MKLNFKSMGSGKPLIILHGLLGSLDNWQSVGRILSDHFKVYLVDQRNHGKSGHSEEMNYDLMTEDLKEFMEAEGLDEAQLIGHSMGGKTAMHFALEYPEKVSKLVVVDIAPRQYEPGHDQIFKALFALNPSELESRNDAQEKLEYYIHDQGVQLFLLKNLQREKNDGFSWKMNLDGIYNNYDNILEEIESTNPFEKPTLFISGGKSDYIQDEDTKRIKSLFPKAEIETIQSAGHWVHAEAQDDFLEHVSRFLDQ